MKAILITICFLLFSINLFSQNSSIGISSGYVNINSESYKSRFNSEINLSVKINNLIFLNPNFRVYFPTDKVENQFRIYRVNLNLIFFPFKEIENFYFGFGIGYYFNDSGENLKEFLLSREEFSGEKILYGELDYKYGYNFLIGYMFDISKTIKTIIQTDYVLLSSYHDKVLIKGNNIDYSVINLKEKVNLNHLSVNIGFVFFL